MLEVIISLAALTIIGVRIMSALDNLNANVATLRATADLAIAKLEAPPVPQSEDPGVQAAADAIAKVSADLAAAMTLAAK